MTQVALDMDKIPYAELETLFLDAGNTLISIDFDWVCAELEKLGIDCDPGELRRAEAASRPLFSDQIEEFRKESGLGIQRLYLTKVLKQLPAEIISSETEIPQIAGQLIPVLFPEGNAFLLYSYVLPGVREALKRFKEMGLQLVVVSNADGTVERQLVRDGLRSYFDVVIDSHVVGVEKPDPKIFQIALDASGATAQHTIYVGDIFHVDVLGARAAGLSAVLLDPYSDWQDVDCEKVADLLSLCEKISSARR